MSSDLLLRLKLDGTSLRTVMVLSPTEDGGIEADGPGLAGRVVWLGTDSDRLLSVSPLVDLLNAGTPDVESLSVYLGAYVVLLVEGDYTEKPLKIPYRIEDITARSREVAP